MHRNAYYLGPGPKQAKNIMPIWCFLPLHLPQNSELRSLKMWCGVLNSRIRCKYNTCYRKDDVYCRVYSNCTTQWSIFKSDIFFAGDKTDSTCSWSAKYSTQQFASIFCYHLRIVVWCCVSIALNSISPRYPLFWSFKCWKALSVLSVQSLVTLAFLAGWPGRCLAAPSVRQRLKG